MSSINTNASAMTALQSLSATNKNLSITQSRISTGFRVAEASDNAAYWSIATTMRSDNKANSVVNDALGLGASKVDTAYAGMNKAIESVNQIKEKLVAAYGASGADKAKIQTEIKAIQDHLTSSTKGATFSGANWLSVDSTDHTAAGTFDTVKIVSSFTRSAAGSVSIETIDVDVDGMKLFDAGATGDTDAGILESARDDTGAIATGGAFGIMDLAVHDGTDGAADTDIQSMMTAVDTALKEMTDSATKLGAAKNRIDLQKEFTQSLVDSIDRGVGQLVDADMNKESTRLQALQVQQQLGIQALTIANSNTQSILSLFR
ncbi:flagellin [Mesorhizobium sp. Root157]|uniref:flagellin N-terminal helical domain-containing protein n=1 Tax=Mesorhizobium sp. Root157 TaxID=1736477 RepID=UPI0006FEEE54|nr:flagellin [Mesorhizobium sp. Root157]KQZ87004.1 flagellin [Mesorhizobium sp. Root157]